MPSGPQSSREESLVDGLLKRLGHPTVHLILIGLSLLMLAALGLVLAVGTWLLQQQAAVPTTTPRISASARISVDPSSGLPGALLNVAGQNWRPSDVVFVSLEAPFVPSDPRFAYAGAVADQGGQFKVSFTLPEEDRWQHAGAIKVVAWAERSGDKAVTIFQVLSPVSVTPVLVANSATLTSTLGLAPVATGLPNSPRAAATRPVGAATATPASRLSAVALAAEGWYGEYFANPTLSGSPAFLRSDPEIRFDWGSGSPGSNVGPDDFSVRWTRSVNFPGGVYRFFARADDGVRAWVDDKLLIDQWHSASSTTYVADTYLWEGPHLLRVEYDERKGRSAIQLWWEKQEVYPDWRAEYFNNRELRGQPALVRNDSQIGFNWGNEPPAAGMSANDFSARWTRRVRFPAGTYSFYTRADGPMRVWLDSSVIVDYWQTPASGLRTADLSLAEGEYSVRVEYARGTGDGRAEFRWEQLPSLPTGTPRPIATVTRRPTIPASAAMLAEPIASPTPRPMTIRAMAVRPVSATVGITVALQATAARPVSAAVGITVTLQVTPGLVKMMALPQKPAPSRLTAESLPDSSVLVRGSGWPAGEEVLIYLRAPGEDLPALQALQDEAGRTSPDDNGNIGLTLKLPAKWRDVPAVGIVAYTADGISGARASVSIPPAIPVAQQTAADSPVPTAPQVPVEVRPSLRVEPAELAPGTHAIVSGEGWKPGEQVLISLVEPGADPGEAPALARALVDECGMFSAGVTAPEDLKWDNQSELIVLAHSIDWTTRAVTPLRFVRPISAPTPSPSVVSPQSATS